MAPGLFRSGIFTPFGFIGFGILQTVATNWLSLSFHAYQAELFPTRIRGMAVGFVYSWSRLSAVFTGCLIAFVLGHGGVPGVFAFIAGAIVVVIATVLLFGPRTSNRSLDEIASLKQFDLGCTGPLADVRVLDLSRLVCDDMLTMMLGDFGADVIKVENSFGGGDPLRSWKTAGAELFWSIYGRNKRSLMLDLSGAGGRALLQIGMHGPVADRLGGRLELASQVGRVATSADQLDHLAPELRRIRWTCLGHKRTPRAKALSVSTRPGEPQPKPQQHQAALTGRIRLRRRQDQ